MRSIEKVQKNNGTGDLIFESILFYDSEGEKSTRKIGFVRLKDVKKVEDIINRELLSSQVS